MADWQYRGGEGRYANPDRGYERYPAGGDRYPAPDARRGGAPSPVSKRPRRDYDGYGPADELPPARGTSYPPRGERDVAYAPRSDRPYDDRSAGRSAWRDQDMPPSDLVYGSNMGPPGGGQLGMPAAGGLVLPDDSLLVPPGGRGLPPLDRGPLVMNGEPERSNIDMLPADASATLFIDGLPMDCTRREAAHIFRPFIGYKEVRLVHKDAKRAAGEKVVLCFVEFADPRCAATALEALQGYRFDENERDSPTLRLTFARNPGPRGPPLRDEHYRGGGPVSGGGYRSEYRDDDYRGRGR